MDGSIFDTIGSLLVRVDSPEGSTITAKMESKSPGGSAKDRPALAMVKAAEEADDISPGDHLIEPTSGNTGIGFAVIAAAKGHGLTTVMSDSMSSERHEIMRAYEATIKLVDGSISVTKDRAGDLEAKRMYQLRQFENPTNPEAHYRTTARKVLEQVSDRRIDALVVGIGTGGTVLGIGSHLAEEFPSMRAVGVEPVESAIPSDREVGDNDSQGMGPGFVSPNLGADPLDDVEIVELADAEAECRRLAYEEGTLVGQSSSASLLVAKHVAGRPATPDADEEDQSLVVTVFWSSGERYMSTGMFDAGEQRSPRGDAHRPNSSSPILTTSVRSTSLRSWSGTKPSTRITNIGSTRWLSSTP